MSIGEKIKQRREELGLTTKELAQLIGVSQAAISNYELGLNNPKTDIMPKILDVLHVDANYMFQDMCKSDSAKASPTSKELIMIEKFRTLDTYGMDMVETVLQKEYDRCQSQKE